MARATKQLRQRVQMVCERERKFLYLLSRHFFHKQANVKQQHFCIKMMKVDMVLEVRDARIPLTSQNTTLNEILGSKPRLVVLNKSDLADRW